MKTLYDILGLGATATPEQVEHAYTAMRARLEANQEGLPASELHNQRVAVKEAYATLSDPQARQQYDQKLAMVREARERPPPSIEAAEPAGTPFGIKALLVIGMFVLAAIYLYNEKAKERERLRIEHEHELQMKAVQIEEDRQRHNARMQDAAETMADNAALQERLAQQRQFEADSAQRERTELQRQQIELRNRQLQVQRQEREDAMRQQREQMQAQQRAQAEKRYLQQLEREHYGKVITY